MYEYKFIIYSSADKCLEFGTYKMFFVGEKKKNKTKQWQKTSLFSARPQYLILFLKILTKD